MLVFSETCLRGHCHHEVKVRSRLNLEGLFTYMCCDCAIDIKTVSHVPRSSQDERNLTLKIKFQNNIASYRVTGIV